MYPNSYNYFQPTPTLKGRIVGSLEEVKAANIDFDGTVYYFPDITHQCIYTKQFNLDGTSSLLMYKLQPIQEAKPNYVTHEELEKALQGLMNNSKKKGGNFNDKSNASDSND